MFFGMAADTLQLLWSSVGRVNEGPEEGGVQQKNDQWSEGSEGGEEMEKLFFFLSLRGGMERNKVLKIYFLSRSL